MASLYGLENHGLTNLRRVYWNLPAPALYEEAVHRSEGQICHRRPVRRGHRASTPPAPPPTSSSSASRPPRSTSGGASTTGPSTRRASARCTRGCCGYLQGRDVFVQDVYGGADPEHRLPVRDHHPEGLAQPLRPHDVPARTRRSSEARRHVPDFTIIAAPGFQASPMVGRDADARRSSSSTSAQKLGIIGGTRLRGRDQEDRLHRPQLPAAARGRAARCTARRTWATDGDAAIFFGLSGTGKTTLSRRSRAPARRRRRARLGRRTASSTSRTAATRR